MCCSLIILVTVKSSFIEPETKYISIYLHGNNIPQYVTLRNRDFYAGVHNARVLVGYGICWGLKRTQVHNQMSFGLWFCHSLSS